MKKTLVAVLCFLYAVFCVHAQEPQDVVNLQAVKSACSDLPSGSVSSETFRFTQPLTVLAAGRDIMVVRDNSYVGFFISNESASIEGGFSSLKPGQKLENVVIRYQDRDGMAYGIYREAALPSVNGTASVYFSAVDLASSTMSYPAAFATVSLTKLSAAINKTAGTLSVSYTRQGTECTGTVHAAEMGIDLSTMADGDYLYNIKGVYIPGVSGCDIYPSEMSQLVPVRVADIATLVETVSNSGLSGTSDNEYIIGSKVTVLALSSSQMYIQDSSGAMEIKNGKIPGGSKYSDLTLSGYRQGDQIENLQIYMNRSTGYAVSINGVYASNTFPSAISSMSVTPDPVTPDELKKNGPDYYCHLVKMENVNIRGGYCDGISVNTVAFGSFSPDAHALYTITAIYTSTGSLALVSMEKTGDVPPLVPVEVSDIRGFLDAFDTASFDSSGISADIYRITGTVVILNKTRTMFVEDASAGMEVTAKSTSNISNCGYTFGTKVSGLTFRLYKVSNKKVALFDPDECVWPEGSSADAEPRVTTAATLSPSDKYRYVVMEGVEMSAANAFSALTLPTAASPQGPSTVSCNRTTLNVSTIASLTKGQKYDITGILYPTYLNEDGSANGWGFYLRTATPTPDIVVIACEDIADLKTKTASIAVGQTSAEIYELGVISISAVAREAIFAQTMDDDEVNSGFKFIPSGSTGFETCLYQSGQLVNGLRGHVRNEGGNLVMLVDGTTLPGSTLRRNLDPTATSLQSLIGDNALTNVLVSIESVPVVAATRASGYSMEGIDIVNGLVSSDATINSSGVYDLEGVFDGTAFYLTSAEAAVSDGVILPEMVSGDVKMYDIQGRLVKSTDPAPGIYIMTGPEGSRKIRIVK